MSSPSSDREDAFNSIVARLANQINTDIAKLIRGCHFSKSKAALQSAIMSAFFAASQMGSSVLEAVKHNVSREQSDFIDMRDLLAALPDLGRKQLFELFRMSPPATYTYATIVISDLDCTAIERAEIADPVYRNGSVVMGFAPLVNALTHQGATTMTFISARPKFMENWSIKSVARTLRDSGLHSFSFEAGKVPGSALFLAAQTARRAGAKKRARELLMASASEFAGLKFASYLQLSAIFPNARFVFFGDDAQGDYLFAESLVRHNERNFAFIRDIAAPDMKVVPASAGTPSIGARIIHHRSYYEALCLLPPGLISDDQSARAYADMSNEYLTRLGSNDYPSSALARDEPWLSRVLSGCVRMHTPDLR